MSIYYNVYYLYNTMLSSIPFLIICDDSGVAKIFSFLFFFCMKLSLLFQNIFWVKILDNGIRISIDKNTFISLDVCAVYDFFGLPFIICKATW